MGLRLLRTLTSSLLFAVATLAGANDAPVRILVGFPPGGGSDLMARLVAERMRATLGTPVIVENKPSVNGVLAAEALRNAAPDGKTLMVSPIVVTVFAPLTQAKLPYDPSRHFAPVSLAASYQLALAVGPDVPAKTLHAYVEWARANPAKATYGVPTVGGPPHFFGVLLSRAATLDITPVPYKGTPLMINDIIGGQVPAGIGVLAEMLPFHQSGKLRILASSGARRSPVAPDVPTFAESGYPDIQGDGWQAFHTTAGTPRAVIDRLSAVIAAAINAPENRERLLAAGFEPVGGSPDELARRIREDLEKWGPIVKASGFRVSD